MARLTDIAAEIAELLQSITVANGFSFDFGTVNQPDLALCRYPAADITYLSDAPQATTQAAYGYDVAQFVVKLVAQNPNSNAVSNPAAGIPTPVHAIDEVIDTVVAAMKQRVRFQQGYLPLSGNAYMIYKGFRKTVEKSGDIFRPDSVLFNLEVHYQSTELEDFSAVAPFVATGAGDLVVVAPLVETL
jgi:hypothetical protein